jgi:prepilin-type N-terminal cleavage/methylation domain-containing protein
MRNQSQNHASRRAIRKRSGFTLVELLLAMGLGGMMVGGVVYGYLQAAKSAEWSAYSLAAQSLAIQRLEQTRAAKWNPLGTPPVDEVLSTNFPQRVEILDIPINGTNVVYATNRTTIVSISTAPALKMIRVDTTWAFCRRGVFTNSIATYRSPDQ